MIDLNDADILRIEKGPLAYMRAKQGSHMDVEGFRKAVIEQFAMVGFDVVLRVFSTTQEGMYQFEPEIVGRNHYAKAFDPDQMSWEVRNNILELPDKEAGVIKSDPGIMRDLLSGGRPDQNGHKH